MSGRELSFAQAIYEALAQAMEKDDRVFIMGEDIGVYGGAFGVTGDLIHRFGEDRVRDTPIAELGGAGVAVGAGPRMRPSSAPASCTDWAIAVPATNAAAPVASKTIRARIMGTPFFKAAANLRGRGQSGK